MVDASGEIYGDVANVAARVQPLAQPRAGAFASAASRRSAMASRSLRRCPDAADTQILQVLHRQIRQDSLIDMVFAECRLVLF